MVVGCQLDLELDRGRVVLRLAQVMLAPNEVNDSAAQYSGTVRSTELCCKVLYSSGADPNIFDCLYFFTHSDSLISTPPENLN